MVPFTIKQTKLQSESKGPDIYNLKQQGETLVMTKCLLCCLLVGLTNAFLFYLDLNHHAGLENGNTIPAGSGSYLRDSFRNQVLVPAFKAVEEELKYNRRSDMIIESLLAGATVSLMIGIGALALKLRNLRKELITLKNKEGP